MTASRPPGLPNFKNPPLVEVGLSIHFDALEGLRTALIGAFWDRDLRQFYPEVADQPPVIAQEQRFDEGVEQPLVELFVETGPMQPRVWFISKGQTEVVQIQRDFFGFNWRKIGTSDEYAHFEQYKTLFVKRLEQFQTFLREEGLGEITPRQCEVTYVNQIVQGEGWQDFSETHKVIRAWNWVDIEDDSLRHEQVRFSSRYVLVDSQGVPLGRLFVQVQPGRRRSDGAMLLIVTLTARGRPDGTRDIASALRFMDRGRAAIVRTFTAITTDEMWRTWERFQ